MNKWKRTAIRHIIADTATLKFGESRSRIGFSAMTAPEKWKQTTKPMGWQDEKIRI